jgi:hypothetical protein
MHNGKQKQIFLAIVSAQAASHDGNAGNADIFLSC